VIETASMMPQLCCPFSVNDGTPPKIDSLKKKTTAHTPYVTLKTALKWKQAMQ